MKVGIAVKLAIATCVMVLAGCVRPKGETTGQAPLTLSERYAAALKKVDAAFAGASRDCCEAVRVEKRRVMSDRLLKLVERDAKLPEAARRYELERADMEMFIEYFEREVKMWEKSPRNKRVKLRVYNVRDFGAKGDGVASETAAFHAAFKAVRAAGGEASILEIPAGTYLFDTPDWPELPYVSRFGGGIHKGRHEYPANLEIQGLENCLIRGEGAEKTKFVFGVYDAFGINLRNTENVTLSGVEVAWKETPFIEGKIIASDITNRTCDIVWNARSMSPNDKRFKVKRIFYTTQYTADGTYDKRTQASLAYYNGEAVDLGEGKWRLKFIAGKGMFAGYSWSRPMLPVGNIICIGDRNDRIECIVAPSSISPVLEGVWVRNSRCGAFTMGECYQPNLWRCRILPREGLTMSTCADGFFSPPGSFIAECDFSQMGDDGCNPHAIGGFVCEVEGNKAIHWAVSGVFTPEMAYNFIDVKSGEYVATLHALSRTSTTYDGKPAQITTFREQIPPSVKSFKSLGLPPFKNKVVQVTKLSELPRECPSVAFAPNAAGIGFVCSGNRFSSFRGNASMQIQCSNSLIENNIAEKTGSGIKVSSLLNYREGPPPYNVFIRSNLIRNTLTGIKCRTYALDEESPVSGMPMSDISIVSNRLENCTGESFRLANINGGEVVGNEFDGATFYHDVKLTNGIREEGNRRNGQPFAIFGIIPKK